jgi:hypothetical protein
MKSAHLFLITLLCAGLLAGCSKKEEPAPQTPSSDVSQLISATLRKEAASLDGRVLGNLVPAMQRQYPPSDRCAEAV